MSETVDGLKSSSLIHSHCLINPIGHENAMIQDERQDWSLVPVILHHQQIAWGVVKNDTHHVVIEQRKRTTRMNCERTSEFDWISPEQCVWNNISWHSSMQKKHKSKNVYIKHVTKWRFCRLGRDKNRSASTHRNMWHDLRVTYPWTTHRRRRGAVKELREARLCRSANG